MQSGATRTEKGRISDPIERNGPVGSTKSKEEAGNSAPLLRPAQSQLDAGPALVCTVSPVSTQYGTTGRFYAVASPKSCSTGQIGVNSSTQVKTATATLIPQPRTRSPEGWRHCSGQLLNCVPEDAEMSTEPTMAARRSETSLPRCSPHMTQKFYGSTSASGYPISLEIMDTENDLSEEEEECLLDDELAKSGLYRGNYKNIVLLYSFVPLSTLLSFVVLATLPIVAFRSSTPSAFPYPPYLPFPLPEVFTAAGFWSLSHMLRDILYEVSLFLTSWIPFPIFTSILSAILQNASALVLRQLAIPILLIPLYSTERPLFDNGGLYTAHNNFPTWEDVAFKRVWWVALGWAAAEAVVGIKQGYEYIALYKGVLVNVRKTVKEENPTPTPPISDATTGIAQASSHRAAQKSRERKRPLADREADKVAETSRRRDHSSSISSVESGPYDDLSASVVYERQPLLTLRRRHADNFVPPTRPGTSTEVAERILAESIVEQDLEELLLLKSREDIEELYGMPVIQIPVFISCLHRINSILTSLAACLILTAAYMRSTFAYDYSHQGSSPSRSSMGYFQLIFPPSTTFHSATQTTSGSFQLQYPFTPSNFDLVISFALLLVVHTAFSVLHAPGILPFIGVHTFVYISLLAWLGLFFGALGFWNALS